MPEESPMDEPIVDTVYCGIKDSPKGSDLPAHPCNFTIHPIGNSRNGVKESSPLQFPLKNSIRGRKSEKKRYGCYSVWREPGKKEDFKKRVKEKQDIVLKVRGEERGAFWGCFPGDPVRVKKREERVEKEGSSEKKKKKVKRDRISP